MGPMRYGIVIPCTSNERALELEKVIRAANDFGVPPEAFVGYSNVVEVDFMYCPVTSKDEAYAFLGKVMALLLSREVIKFLKMDKRTEEAPSQYLIEVVEYKLRKTTRLSPLESSFVTLCPVDQEVDVDLPGMMLYWWNTRVSCAAGQTKQEDSRYVGASSEDRLDDIVLYVFEIMLDIIGMYVTGESFAITAEGLRAKVLEKIAQRIH